MKRDPTTAKVPDGKPLSKVGLSVDQAFAVSVVEAVQCIDHILPPTGFRGPSEKTHAMRMRWAPAFDCTPKASNSSFGLSRKGALSNRRSRAGDSILVPTLTGPTSNGASSRMDADVSCTR